MALNRPTTLKDVYAWQQRFIASYPAKMKISLSESERLDETINRVMARAWR